MIDAIFRAAGYLSGVIGTIEYRIGDRKVTAPHTTPEAIDLQMLFADMIDEEVTHATMEVSSHALALHRADGCHFAAAVFTNLTPEHLDFHPTMEDYFEAKQRLFTDPQYLPTAGERVNAVNIDDGVGELIARTALGRTLTYGLSPQAHCRAEQIDLRPEGTSFLAVHPTGQVPIRMKLVGEFNVYNALGALAACIGLGIDPEVAMLGHRADGAGPRAIRASAVERAHRTRRLRTLAGWVEASAGNGKASHEWTRDRRVRVWRGSATEPSAR